MMKTVGAFIALAAIWVALTAAFSIQRSVTCPDTEQGYQAAMDECRILGLSQQQNLTDTCSPFREMLACGVPLADACAGSPWFTEDHQAEISGWRTANYYCETYIVA